MEKRNWTLQVKWKNVIISDESQIAIEKNKVYIWKKRDKAENKCHDIGCICYNGVGTRCKVNGTINSDKYIEMLDNNLWPIVVRHVPGDNYIF